jgi:hypothetical protein
LSSQSVVKDVILVAADVVAIIVEVEATIVVVEEAVMEWVVVANLEANMVVRIRQYESLFSRPSADVVHDSPFEINTIPGRKVYCITGHWLRGRDMEGKVCLIC